MLRSLFSFALFFISTFLFAQEKKITPYPMTESSLLWEISGNEIPQGSYLFGTMHLIEKDYFIFPKKLEKIVSKSDVLVMELPGLPDQAEALKYVMLTEGTFFDYFSPAQTDSILAWAQTQLKLSEAGFRATFSGMKPFTVVQMATQLHFMGKTESYEMTLERLAKEHGVAIAGLETIAEQMALFDDLTKEQQQEMVMESIRDPHKAIETTTRMMQVYSRQNVDSLYLMIEEEGGTIEEEQAKFLDDRNSKWIPMIEAHIAEKKSFIAVGAGHLGGPAGVIRLLEERGYTLTPVKL